MRRCVHTSAVALLIIAKVQLRLCVHTSAVALLR